MSVLALGSLLTAEVSSPGTASSSTDRFVSEREGSSLVVDMFSGVQSRCGNAASVGGNVFNSEVCYGSLAELRLV